MDAKKRNDAVAKIYARAWSDSDYMARLKSDPHSVLTEVGLHAPRSLVIEVHDESDGRAHFVVPNRPDDVTDAQLDSGEISSDICSAGHLHTDICSFT